MTGAGAAVVVVVGAAVVVVVVVGPLHAGIHEPRRATMTTAPSNAAARVCRRFFGCGTYGLPGSAAP